MRIRWLVCFVFVLLALVHFACGANRAPGFIALDGLRGENAGGTTGNYGLLDQRFGMEWVQVSAARARSRGCVGRAVLT